jgi:septum formation protein
MKILPIFPLFRYFRFFRNPSSSSPPNSRMLILASSSPRRAELLRAAGIEFAIRIPDIDETRLPGESPQNYALRLSREKAMAVPEAEELVLGADTIVIINNEIAGKPADLDDARRMLNALSGRRHEVLTAVTLICGERVLSEVESTHVSFSRMSEEEIEWYISTGEPMDKAGAYGIQGYASRFVERIEGNYSNVVGLPVSLIYQMAKRLGFEF